MEWWLVLLLIVAGLAFLFIIGVPITFAFLMINIIGVFLLWNGSSGLNQLTLNMFHSIAKFSLLPIPMFLLMGELMFRTGVGVKIFEAMAKWMSNIRGKFSFLAVGTGTLFAVLTGSSAASAALLGSLLVPDMKKKGYSTHMSIGPILGSAGLATMIPPTALGVLLASLAAIPVGHFLIAIVIPGILLALLFVVYIFIMIIVRPDLAPSDSGEKYSMKEKIIDTCKYILPLGAILFLVLGVIILGIATPTQSAVLGALGTIGLAICYKSFSWKILWESLVGTLNTTGMIFMIIIGSATFGQILSYTGVTQSLVQILTNIDVHPLMILVLLQLVLLILGCFMEPLSIMMITLPILMPISQALAFNPIWFCVIILLNMQMATLTPPFGMDLFAIKGVVPSLKMSEIYKAAWPFVGLNIILMILLIVFPSLSLWLPSFLE